MLKRFQVFLVAIVLFLTGIAPMAAQADTPATVNPLGTGWMYNAADRGGISPDNYFYGLYTRYAYSGLSSGDNGTRWDYDLEAYADNVTNGSITGNTDLSKGYYNGIISIDPGGTAQLHVVMPFKMTSPDGVSVNGVIDLTPYVAWVVTKGNQGTNTNLNGTIVKVSKTGLLTAVSNGTGAGSTAAGIAAVWPILLVNPEQFLPGYPNPSPAASLPPAIQQATETGTYSGDVASFATILNSIYGPGSYLWQVHYPAFTVRVPAPPYSPGT